MRSCAAALIAPHTLLVSTPVLLRYYATAFLRSRAPVPLRYALLHYRAPAPLRSGATAQLRSPPGYPQSSQWIDHVHTAVILR
jgi:hypothetical protein